MMQVYLKGDMVVREGEVSREMYFIKSGAVQVPLFKMYYRLRGACDLTMTPCVFHCVTWLQPTQGTLLVLARETQVSTSLTLSSPDLAHADLNSTSTCKSLS